MSEEAKQGPEAFDPNIERMGRAIDACSEVGLVWAITHHRPDGLSGVLAIVSDQTLAAAIVQWCEGQAAESPGHRFEYGRFVRRASVAPGGSA